MGINRWEWVRMGSDGCDGVQGHGMTQKQGEKRQKRSCRTCIWPYGRGNFPSHHVFMKFDMQGYLWMQMGANAFA